MPMSHMGGSSNLSCSTPKSSSLLICLSKQQKLGQVLGPLPPIWEIQNKLLPCPWPAYCCHLGGAEGWTITRSVSLSYSLLFPVTAFQVNKIHHKNNEGSEMLPGIQCQGEYLKLQMHLRLSQYYHNCTRKKRKGRGRWFI